MASSWLSKAASMAQAAQERAKEAAEKAAKEAAKFRDEAQAAASGLAQGAERFLLPEAKANHRELVFEEGPLGFEIEGARVIAVDDEGQAARLGLRAGDELLAVDGDVIPSPPAEDTPEEGDARVKRLIRKWIKNKPRPVSLRFTLPVQSNDEPGGSERPAVEDTGVKAPEPDAGEAQDLDELAAGEPADPVQGVAWPDAAELDEGSGDGDGWDLDLAPLDIESDKEAPVTANGNEPSGEQEAVEAATALVEELPDMSTEELQVPDAQEEAVEEPAEPAVLEPEAAEAPAVMEEPADTAEETLQATENATDGWDDLLGVDEQVPNAQEEAVEEPAEPAVLEPEAAEAPAVMEEPADTAEETLQVLSAQKEAVAELAEPAAVEPEVEASATCVEELAVAEEALQATGSAEDGWDDLLGVEQQVPSVQEEAVEEPAEPAVAEPEVPIIQEEAVEEPAKPAAAVPEAIDGKAGKADAAEKEAAHELAEESPPVKEVPRPPPPPPPRSLDELERALEEKQQQLELAQSLAQKRIEEIASKAKERFLQATEEHEREREAFAVQLAKLQKGWDEAEQRVQKLSGPARSNEENVSAVRQQQKQLKKSEEECQKLGAKLEKETAKVEELKQNMDQVIKDAKERDEARMREIKQLRDKSEQEIKSLKERSDLSSKDAEALRQRLLGEASVELQELRSEASQQKEALTGMLRQATTEASELRRSMEQAEAASSEESAEAAQRLAEAEKSQGRLRQELRSTVEKKSRAERELEQAHAECKELLSNSSQRDGRVEVAQALLESRVQSLQDQLEGVRAELEATKAAEEAQRCQAEDAQARCEELQRAADSSAEEWQQKREAMEMELHTLKERLQNQQHFGTSAEAEHRSRLASAEKRAQELEKQASRSAEDFARSQQEASEATLRATHAETALGKLQAESQQSNEAEQRWKAQAEEAQSAADSHKQLIRALQQSMAEQKQQADQELEELRRQLAEAAPMQRLSTPSRLPTSSGDSLVPGGDAEESQAEAEAEVDVAEASQASDLLDQLESSASGRMPSKSSGAPPEAAGHEEAAQLWDRINYLEKRCRTLQKKLDARPIIYQAPTGYGPLNLEAGDSVLGRPSWEPWLREVTGQVARRLRLPQGSEQRVASVAAPLCQAIEVPLRNFTQRLLRRDRWLFVFYAHLIVLYAICASCVARSSNPVSPAECVDTRLKQLQAQAQQAAAGAG